MKLYRWLRGREWTTPCWPNAAIGVASSSGDPRQGAELRRAGPDYAHALGVAANRWWLCRVSSWTTSARNNSESVAAHELAHLLRHNHRTNMFVAPRQGECSGRIRSFGGPIASLAQHRKLCCDAIAIDCCKATRRSYAATLLKALEFIQAEPLAPARWPWEWAQNTPILRRFEMIGEGTDVLSTLTVNNVLSAAVFGDSAGLHSRRGQEKEPCDAHGRRPLLMRTRQRRRPPGPRPELERNPLAGERRQSHAARSQDQSTRRRAVRKRL